MAGLDAFGTKWQIKYVATFTDVAEITSIDVLDIDVETIETSSHSSAGQWREFAAGMKDGGELSMEINYDPALHATLLAEVGADPKDQKIILPDAGLGEVTYKGIVTGFQAQAPYDDKLAATVTVKATGAVTFTP